MCKKGIKISLDCPFKFAFRLFDFLAIILQTGTIKLTGLSFDNVNSPGWTAGHVALPSKVL
jgi:hypothetical protein